MSWEEMVALQMNANRDADTIAEWRENRDQWMNHAKKLEAEVTDLMDKLMVEVSCSEGLQMALDAFKEQHPDSPLMRQAGQFQSGNPKRAYHTFYEHGFDTKARSLGITNPVSRRAN